MLLIQIVMSLFLKQSLKRQTAYNLAKQALAVSKSAVTRSIECFTETSIYTLEYSGLLITARWQKTVTFSGIKHNYCCN